jgi:hypothetical protein
VERGFCKNRLTREERQLKFAGQFGSPPVVFIFAA